MAHKYLNKLGIKSNNCSIFNPVRLFSFEELKQKWTHGFSAWQEVGNLDTTSAMWLYEHIKVYRDTAMEIIDFDADPSRYDIPVLYDLDEIEYHKGNKLFPIAVTKEVIESHSQLEAIDYIIKYLEYYLTEPDFPVNDNHGFDLPLEEAMNLVAYSEAKQWASIRCAFKIYAVIIGSMWI